MFSSTAFENQFARRTHILEFALSALTAHAGRDQYSRSWSSRQPMEAQGSKSILLPAMKPGEKMAGKTFEQPNRGDLDAALLMQRRELRFLSRLVFGG